MSGVRAIFSVFARRGGGVEGWGYGLKLGGGCGWVQDDRVGLCGVLA